MNMAVSSDADIFEVVNQALQGLNNPDNDTDHEDQLDDCLATMTTVTGTKERYTAQIERLREEVTSLEEQVEADEQKLLQIKMESLDRIQSSLQMGKNSSSIGTDQATQDHLKLQGAFTGIQYTDATVRIVKQDAEQTTRQHCLQGQCSGLSFQVEFQVKERLLTDAEKKQLPTGSNQETRSHVKSLAIQIDDRALWELEPFVREAERDCALQPFLRGYSQYAQRFTGRQKALEHFKKQYPEAVMLPLGSIGSTLKFSRPSQGSVQYIITWNIGLSSTGRADQQISLQVMPSKQMRQLDEQNVLASAPERFQQMLHRLGIERTIDSFIQAVTT
ncbi:centromere protein P-like [Acanthaster planci]|uniref:Centromere protein P-like n=1 Tax=Acanthaster planci TaxID=133434 RepID=A0A8B7YLK3_ACAPL|nr:centromere protein P-like [Acanthaster planci]XP_022092375.1 centromere protein P-like [Acanthaster planci]XP_022092376.1 centromere protein P-like [Acanthaster planci]XP_022092377.1 centromere protein P-like [Acanthaster planci]XP_022092378.1 centromere protein P-like [Acanthaster planci]